MQKSVFTALTGLLLGCCLPGISVGRYNGTVLVLQFGKQHAYRRLGLPLQQRMTKELRFQQMLQSDLDVNTVLHGLV